MAIVAGGQSGRSEGEETRISSFKEEAPVVNAVGMYDDAVLLEAELERTQVVTEVAIYSYVAPS